MKLLVIPFLILMFSSSLIDLRSQNVYSNPPLDKLKIGNTLLFGKDIIINDQPDQNQKIVSVCSAFNGWLYAIIGYHDSIHGTFASFTLLRSQDSGLTWAKLFESYEPISNSEYSRLSIVATGNSEAELKLIILALVKVGPLNTGIAYVSVYNGMTGLFEYPLFDTTCYDFTIASDYIFPAINSNPNSLGFLYSIPNSPGDSICFRYSSDGGITISPRKAIFGTEKHLRNVALSYGRSLTWNSGRYFAVWEELENQSSPTGHIYTNHSDPNFNSPFTNSVQLDSLNAANYNKCKNPVIACQYNNSDNDSSNFTELILFEKFDPSNQLKNVIGYYNLQAANHNKFKPFFLANQLDNNLAPDIAFNPYDSTFMVTYYDSTEQKLPFFTNNYNFINPNQWSIVTSGYNDSTNLSTPFPKVFLNFNLHTGLNSWIAKGANGNSTAMFDSRSNTWTSVQESNKIDESLNLQIYPNPCSDLLTISFELKRSTNVSLEVFNFLGRKVASIANKYFSAGKHILHSDMSKLSSGNYFYHFSNGDFNSLGKIIIIH